MNRNKTISIISFASVAFWFMLICSKAHMINEIQNDYFYTLLVRNDGIFWIEFIDFFQSFFMILGVVGFIMVFLDRYYNSKLLITMGLLSFAFLIFIMFISVFCYYSFNYVLKLFVFESIVLTSVKYMLFIISAYACFQAYKSKPHLLNRSFLSKQ